MRSSSSELISVYRAPNLHIDNAKMSKVTAPRLHLNLQKPQSRRSIDTYILATTLGHNPLLKSNR